MKVRTLRVLAAAVVGAVTVSSAMAQEPAKLKLPTLPETKSALKAQSAPAPKSDTLANQQLADKIAEKITGTAAANYADVSVYAEKGVVTVTGTCREESQKSAILKVVSNTDGVTLVRDGVKVAPAVKQAQAIGPRENPAPFALPPSAGMGFDPNIEPMPLGQAGGGGGMGAGPNLPPYAWPTYAPYPNMSRVGYPTAYPQNAFPFIGPFYPFPKVPLGWRSVTLSWEDGHWWMGRKQTPQDYWRVKFGY